MSHKQPWKVTGSPWKTEAAFWNYIRGVLRKGWSRFPIKLEFIKQNRKRIPNPNPKGKVKDVWGMTCNICKKDTVQADIQIDHIGESSSFQGLHHVESYVAHLFLVDFDSLRPLCTSCHKIVNQAQRSGVSFEEAATEKEIIRLLKTENRKECLDILQSFGYSDVTNQAKRKKALVEIFSKEK